MQATLATLPPQDVTSVSDVPESNSSAPVLRVAFASLDGECVDQHFGSAQGFYVWEVGATSQELIAVKHFPKELKDGNEDKLKPKLAWLLGADLVYCGSIGGSAVRQLVSIGVNPVKVKEGPDVEEIVADLQDQLAGEPSALVARILQQKYKNTNTTDNDFEDDWDE